MPKYRRPPPQPIFLVVGGRFMYGFPDFEKLKPIINQELIQIGCTLNQINLFFGLKICITCEKEFVYIDENGIELEINLPLSSLRLLSLLECKAKSIELINKHSIVITFMGNKKLILTEDEMYESFNLQINSEDLLI
jgi:hypothetical protein